MFILFLHIWRQNRSTESPQPEADLQTVVKERTACNNKWWAARWDLFKPSFTDPVIRTLNYGRGENNGETTGFSETHQACPNLELTREQPNARLHTPASLLADQNQSLSGQTDKRDNVGSDDTAAAVTALVQMQGSGLNSYTPTNTSRISKENLAINWAPDMTNFYNHVQSRADTEGSQQVLTQTNWTYPLCNTNSSTSGISVHDTISNLSSTISSMRQQQAVMASALGNLINVIQDMRAGPRSAIGRAPDS